MSNINKQKLYAYTWKDNIAMLIFSIICLAAILFMWIKNYTNINLELLWVTGGFLCFGMVCAYLYRRGYPIKKLFPLDPEKRQKIIEENIIGRIKYNHFYDAKIEGSEETLRKEIKTILVKLAEEY